MAEHDNKRDAEITHDRPHREADQTEDKAIAPNPPRTTAGGITAPKFGSAGSGGAELEPGHERD
jgi:hypothetical protein